MRKSLIILSALLLTGIGAWAQTYTGNLSVSVEGSESNTPDSQVTVKWDETDPTKLDFTLHEFSIDISGVSLDLGDITVKEVDVVEGTDGAVTISCTEDHEVEFSKTLISLLANDPTVTMTGEISEEKLYANMTINVTVLGSTYDITATFASSGDDDLSGSYMIVNTETDQFLYGSYNWGCRASLGSKPVFFTVNPTGENTYTLSTQQWTATRYMYLSGDFYCDSSTATDITLTETGIGVYTISYNGSYMLQQGKNAGTTVTTDASQASHFKFVSLQDVIDSMEDASSSNPVDVTALIDDANFKPGGNGLTATNQWTESNINHGSYTGNTVVACCAEAYESTYSISQSITLPKKGIYILNAQGFYRNGYDGTSTYTITAQMFAGDNYVNLPARITTANSMGDAWSAFLDSSEPIDPITIEADNDETSVSIGFSGSLPSGGNWAIFGELELLYYGEELTYAIGEPEWSVSSVTPGSEMSITFPNCITPTDDEVPVLSTTAGSITVNGTAVTATLTYSGTTATVTFTVPETIGRGEEVTVIVPAGLVEWSGQRVSSPAEAVTITLTTPLIDDQQGVYLFNLGENEFLSRGHNYNDTDGTAADVDVYGLPVDITANAEGKYNIRYIDSNLYLGGEYWATSNAALTAAASFTLVEDGTNTDGKTIYRFRNGSSNSSVTGDLYVNNGTSHGPLGLNDDDNGIKSEADRQWVIYTKTERDAYKAENVLNAKLNAAQSLTPSFSGTSEDDFDTFISGLYSEDVTSKVSGANLSSDTDLGYWTEDDYSLEGGGFAVDSNVIETYEDVDDLTQPITGLEEGIYKVTLQGFNRMGAASWILANLAEYDISLATLGANDDEINLKTWASDRAQMSGESGYDDSYPNSMAEAAACFTAGLYQNELYTYVGEGGSLTITIACPDYLGANWVIFTNMTLTRYYTDDTYVYDVTKMLANPSFETPTVSELAGGENADKRGSYAITDDQLTGWTLVAPTNADDASRAVCDIMTKDASETDDDYGKPGTPSDADQMLYLRNSWTTSTASVTQSVTLPAGSYKLAVDSKCVTTISGPSATLVVNDASVNLPTHSAYDGDDLTWDTSSLKFEVTGNTEEVTIGVNVSFDGHPGLSVLLDNFRLYSENDIVEWTLGADYGTLILPFAADVPSGLKAYTAVTVSSDELTLTNAGSISANTPHIIGGTAGTYYFAGVPTNGSTTSYSDNSSILMGTLPAVQTSTTNYLYTEPTTVAVSQGNYVLQNQDDTTAFYLVDSDDITCGSYHCYLNGTAVTSGVKSITFTFGDDVATRIDAVESADAESEAIYDLSGRRVAKAQKGIYIVNGKKMVIK